MTTLSISPRAGFAALALTGMLLAGNAEAQITTPQPSPKSTVTQRVGLTDITITYSRPSLKGRTAFGAASPLAPLGKRWRTGANATTTIKFSDEVIMEGKKIPAGEYGLYSIPNKDAWAVVLNKNTKLGANVDGFKDEDNVATFSAKTYKLLNKVETFTINFSDLTPATANVDMQWENTGAKFRITTEVDAKVMAQINEKVVNGGAAVTPDNYAAAAVYYYDNNKDLKQALTWIQKANEKDPKFWNVQTEAKIRLKMKDYKGAITAAEQSKKLATEAKNNDYVKMNDDLIAEAKKSTSAK
jgi:tetratricopeptide (TPR) repeat protein